MSFDRIANMTTPRISYAHLLTEPNPKHVESLVKFFESAAKSAEPVVSVWKSSICRCITAMIPP